MKFCTKCEIAKQNTEFHKDKSRKDGFRDICKECAKLARTKWYADNSNYAREKNNVSSKRRYHSNPQRAKGESLRKYWPNTSWEKCLQNYEKLLIAQNNVCGICESSEISKHVNGKTKDLAVDHNHISGEVRGLLCASCNGAIGSLNADIGTELLVKAIKYVEKK